MRLAKNVFYGAGAWGILLVTPMFFLFDEIGRQRGVPITYPQFFYGFLVVTMAWQLAFLVIGSDPARYRLLMLPAMVEKFGFVVGMCVLFALGQITGMDAAIAAPDFVLGVLFAVAFAKTAGAEPGSAVAAAPLRRDRG